MAGDGNPWKTLGTELRYENGFIRLFEDAVEDPAGGRRGYGVVRFRVRGVGIVAVDRKGRVRLVAQHRYPLGRRLWEIPKGGADPAKPPREEAARELKEETGLTARHWLALPTLDMSPSTTDDTVALFLAWGAEEGETDPDPQEDLSTRSVPLAEALSMVEDGRVTDAATVAALLLVGRLLDRDALPPEVAGLLR